MTTDTAIIIDALDQVRAVASVAPEADRLQPLLLRQVVSGSGAVQSVCDVLLGLEVAPGTPVAILTDSTPKWNAGTLVLDEVALVVGREYAVSTAVLHPHGGAAVVHADEPTIREAVESVSALAPSALVTVGSGTMADIGKVVAAELDLLHVVVQTAASVNGFADDQSVLLLNGAKRTTPSRWPDALVIDSDVLAQAPLNLTRSGLGDQLSMFTAAADWYLASAVGFDTSYSPAAVQVLRDGAEGLLENAGDLGRGEPAAVARLAHALTHGGLAMGIAGRTSPSSGTEHVISHLLEMHAAAHGYACASHGSQVGVASVAAAAVWARVRARLLEGGLVVRALDAEALRDRVRGAFLTLDPTGATADECWTAYQRKLSWISTNLERLQEVCDDWSDYDHEVGRLLRSPDDIRDTLTQAGAVSRFADLASRPQDQTARWALANGHLMRDRFTVVDLAEVTGLWTPDDVDAVYAETQQVSA